LYSIIVGSAKLQSERKSEAYMTKQTSKHETKNRLKDFPLAIWDLVSLSTRIVRQRRA